MFTKNSVTDNDGAGFKSVLRTTLNVHICFSMNIYFVVTNISSTSLLRRMTLAGAFECFITSLKKSVCAEMTVHRTFSLRSNELFSLPCFHSIIRLM